MSCNCTQPVKTPLWTAVPEYRQPTEIQPGENIECYALRSGSQSGLKNDNGAKPLDRIDNTSLASDMNGNVNTTFILTPGSTRTPTGWEIAVNGANGQAPLNELTWNPATGALTGVVSDNNANKQYKVLITANDADGQIDSREFNFFPKKGAQKGQALKFLKPLAGNSHVTCGYGPRTPPAPGASSMHLGYDFAMVDHSHGDVVAACDGVVVASGPATGFGNWIKIEHYDENNVCVATTVYGHMNNGNLYVTVGQKVGAGQKIALEGNAGIGSAAHLHFEIHKGKWKPGGGIDPGPYLDGSIQVANNNDPTQPPSDGGNAPTGGYSNANNLPSSGGMTTAEATASPDCAPVLPNDTAIPPVPAGDQSPPTPPTNNKAANRSSCTDGPKYTSQEVIDKIQQACTEAGYAVGSADQVFIQTVATIESNLDPYAKNPTSTATGLYQMLDAIAVKYYGLIGQTPTCANRCDPYLATKAMIAFYQHEFLPYWNNYNSSGQTKIANKSIQQTAWSVQGGNPYAFLNQGEFMYGLIHHDGVGNAVAGLDKGGVAYWRSKVT